MIDFIVIIYSDKRVQNAELLPQITLQAVERLQSWKRKTRWELENQKANLKFIYMQNIQGLYVFRHTHTKSHQERMPWEQTCRETESSVIYIPL